MATATYDDVNLILRLYELRREDRMRAARDWFGKSFHAKSVEEFGQLCPPGSEANAFFRMVSSYWEMVASFITSGVLNEELFFQSGGELLFCWVRIEPLLADYRKAAGNPAIMKNLEQVAGRFIAHLGPEAYERFSARVRG